MRIISTLLLLVVCLTGYGQTSKGISGSLLEMPKITASDNVIIYTGFTVSYNTKTLIPNWVAYELTDVEVDGQFPRKGQFGMDFSFKGRQAMREDYSNSGWDKGHMCPAADSRWHWKAMQESFYMSNMCPQNRSLNSGSWQELEEFCRTWVEKEGTLYIVCGPIVKGKKYKTIGKNSEKQIVVPDSFFKVLLSMKNNTPLAIGFIYENKAGKQPMKKQARSVDEVERITGIDFFPALSDSIEKQIEADCRPNDWGIKK